MQAKGVLRVKRKPNQKSPAKYAKCKARSAIRRDVLAKTGRKVRWHGTFGESIEASRV